ncbi:MAG: thioredoxin family protein [Methanobacteriota archaeon]
MPAVEILTAPGCAKCERTKRLLAELVARQQEEFPGLAYRIVDVTEHPEIAVKHRLWSTPGIVIDGKLEFHGKAPNEAELVARLREAASRKRVSP